jgi:twitching motility two-component system response regulator PilG
MGGSLPSGYTVIKLSDNLISSRGKKSMNSKTLPTILAVDDSVSMQQLIEKTLKNRYRVMVAGNTVEALGILYHEPVELMLLDVSMPGVDGLEFCRIVRRSPHLKDLPVVMLTAKDTVYDKIEGRLAGATEYLTKPFNAAELLQIIDKILKKKAQSKGAS